MVNITLFYISCYDSKNIMKLHKLMSIASDISDLHYGAEPYADL